MLLILYLACTDDGATGFLVARTGRGSLEGDEEELDDAADDDTAAGRDFSKASSNLLNPAQADPTIALACPLLLTFFPV